MKYQGNYKNYGRITVKDYQSSMHNWIIDSTDSYTSTGTSTYTINSQTTATDSWGTGSSVPMYVRQKVVDICGKQKIARGKQTTLLLPDGTIVEIDDRGNWEINDKNQKKIYEACNIRGFNPYINASDLLEEFIIDLGKLGCTQAQVLDVPIEFFINWLIIKAATQDDDPIPDGVRKIEESRHLLPPPKWGVRCLHCGKFITKRRHAVGINFCNWEHMNKHEIKMCV